MADSQTTNISFGDTSGEGNARVEQVAVKNINSYENARRLVLQDLGSRKPQAERERIIHGKGKLLPGSCAWVFEQDSFRRWWQGDGNTTLLWIHGDPGKGKTMIAEAIIQELYTRLDRDKKSTKVLAYFFCQRGDNQLNTATAILKGLLYSLMVQHEVCAAYLEKHYIPHKVESTSDSSLFWELLSQFTSLISSSRDLEFYFCVDAIDECIVQSDLLLDKIVTGELSAHNVKWILTSRNELYITQRLQDVSNSEHNSLELNSEYVAQAVKDFINLRVDTLVLEKRYSASQSSQIKAHLQQNAKDTFLWVALVFDELRRSKRVDALTKLLAFPPGLKLLYKQMLLQVQKQDDSEEAEICRQILCTVATVYQPQSLEDLAILCDIPSKYETSEDIEELLFQCGSFLTIRDGIVYFVHQSANDFFVTGDGHSIFNSGVKEVHGKIAVQLLQTLRQHLKRDILQIGNPGASPSELGDVHPRLSKILQYGCLHWFLHLFRGSSKGSSALSPSKVGNVDNFLRVHLLNWIECLAWMQQLHFALVGLQDILSGMLALKSGFKSSLDSGFSARVDFGLAARVDSQNNPDTFKNFLRDAIRLLKKFYAIIEIAPLQVYFSALLFSPVENHVRKLFLSQQFPNWLLYEPTIPDTRELVPEKLVETYNYGTMIYFALSNEGGLLASCSSTDDRIRLRHVRSGRLVQILSLEPLQIKHKDFISKRLVFREDDDVLTCLYSPGLVVSWDLTWASNSIGRVLVDQEPGSRFIANISENGDFAAFVSADGRIDVWNLVSEKVFMINRFYCGHAEITKLYVAPDGATVGYEYRDDDAKKDLYLKYGMRIRRTGDGSLLCRLASDSRYLNFSPNGRHIAVGSLNRLDMYDATLPSEEPVWSIKMAFSSIMAFSHDSTSVAVAHDAGDALHSKVSIRASSSGKLLYTVIEDAVPRVSYLGFSASDLVIKTGEEIWLWEVSSRRIWCRKKVLTLLPKPMHERRKATPESETLAVSRATSIYTWDLRDMDGDYSISDTTSSRFDYLVKVSDEGTRIAVINLSFMEVFDAHSVDRKYSRPRKIWSTPRSDKFMYQVGFSSESGSGSADEFEDEFEGQLLCLLSSKRRDNPDNKVSVYVYNAATGEIVAESAINFKDSDTRVTDLQVEFSKRKEFISLRTKKENNLLHVLRTISGQEVDLDFDFDLDDDVSIRNLNLDDYKLLKDVFLSRTDMGDTIGRIAREDHSNSLIQLDMSDEWIMWGDRKLLWLPLEARPNVQRQFQQSYDSAGPTLVISALSDDLLFFGFDTECLSRSDFMSTRKVELDDSRPSGSPKHTTGLVIDEEQAAKR